MDNNRSRNVQWNILSNLGSRVVALLCGLITPRMLIGAFGSEAYGMAMSISQLLSFVTLLEGGVGSVAKARLYDPLARGDMQKVSNIRRELRRFMLAVSTIFAAYALVLAATYRDLSGARHFPGGYVFWLVVAMAAALFAEYGVSLPDEAVLHAGQRSYVYDGAYALATVLNTLAVVLIIRLGGSLLTVKVAGVGIFLLRPLIHRLYISKVFRLPPADRNAPRELSQKWVGMGHNLAQFLQNNTDVALLTLFGELAMVSVYSLYYMVINIVQTIAASVTGGMEALFGDMLARKEEAPLKAAFDQYELAVSLVSVLLFTVAAVLLAPFVLLYTSGIRDADYNQPVLAALLAAGALLICIRQPYHKLIYAAGHFRQTTAAAYGEAGLNVGLSLLLIGPMGVEGIALATVIAVAFRLLYYVSYCAKNILHRSPWQFAKRLGVDLLTALTILLSGRLLLSLLPIPSYLFWILAGCILGITALAAELIWNCLFYREPMGRLLTQLLHRLRKTNDHL